MQSSTMPNPSLAGFWQGRPMTAALLTAPAASRPRHPPPRSVGLCAAWSHHAAELAVPLGQELLRFAETPATARLVADGYVVRLRPGLFVPPDVLGTAISRALLVGCALGGQLQAHHVIAGPTAAWVLLGGVPPTPIELLSPTHRGDLAGVVQRYGLLRPWDVETIGGAPVTVPARTAADLLRFSPLEEAAALVHELVDSGHTRPTQIAHLLRTAWRYPGISAARTRLAALYPQQVPALSSR